MRAVFRVRVPHTIVAVVVKVLSYARAALAAKYNLNCRARARRERSRVMTPLGVGTVNS